MLGEVPVGPPRTTDFEMSLGGLGFRGLGVWGFRGFRGFRGLGFRV